MNIIIGLLVYYTGSIITSLLYYQVYKTEEKLNIPVVAVLWMIMIIPLSWTIIKELFKKAKRYI